MHFFNPVHKMPLVEVVKAPATSDAAAALVTRFAVDLGKTPARVGDGPGFVVNRVLMPYLDEAVRLVGEGMKIKDVDRVMKRFGMPMGPLELLDQIGLDVAAHVARTVRQQLGQPIEPGGVFEKMKGRGWLGQKAKVGFYTHEKGKARPHRAAEELVREGQQGSSLSANLPEAARLAEARERMVLLMVNEAAAVLADGLADPATIDLAMVFGTGWAPHRGGPLRYADDRGLADVVRALEQLASRHGPRFAPCAELKCRATNGERFRQ
jgi:3-hydroxyacyl-CoA dehydrogenase/enoyl-CoA hydratase/3-hydroxybutyryl-CoA epimerase